MFQNVGAFLIQEIVRQRQSVFLWSPVFIGIGIVLFFALGDVVSWQSLVIAGIASGLAISKSYRGYARDGEISWLCSLLVSIAFTLVVFGYGVTKWRTVSLSTPILERDMKPSIITGDIEKLVILDGAKAKRVILSNVYVESEEIGGEPFKVRLKTYHFKSEDWNIGDTVQVKAKLIAPSGPVMPGGFDFRRKAYYEGISAVGYTMADAKIIDRVDDNHSYGIQGIRDSINQRVYEFIDDKKIAAIASALLTGERSGISNEDVEALRISGLAHLLAISGLHIGLVAGCMFFFVRLFLVLIPNMALYHPIKKYAAVCAIIVAFVYMVLAGATVPTVRAFIMTSLVLLAIILDRSALNMRLVALAAIIVMVTTPEAVIGPSFVLSFSAVVALISFYQGAGRKWLMNANSYKVGLRPIYYLAGIIVTTIIATLATAPFSVMFFNRFAVYGVVANILAMPLMAFIVMPFGLIAMLLSPFGLDTYIWSIMAWGIDHVMQVSFAVSSFDFANLYLPSFSDFQVGVIALSFLWIVLWRGILRFIVVPIFVMAFFWPILFPTPKVIMSDKMDAVLYVDKSMDKPYLIGSMNKYLRQNWLGAEGYNPDVNILNYKDGDSLDKSNGYCDDFMCRLNVDGMNVSILLNPLQSKNVCEGSDIVITKIPFGFNKKQCRHVDVIDRFDVWRHGATSIVFTGNGYKISTVK